MTGNEKPEMENDMTPHREAKLNPSRRVGRVPIMTIPQHWDASTRQSVANIIGNIAAGKLLAQHPFATLKYVPAIMAILYLVLYGLGKLTIPTSIVILILGIFAGIANNGNQFMVSTSATEAPDFANGLFLTAANLGTALGAAICGMFITVWGTQSSPLGAVAFLLVGVASIIIRNSLMSRNKHIMAVTI